MLYFITEHIKFREDMTPTVISDRLDETGLGKISASDIEIFFRGEPEKVSPSNTRTGAYKVTARETNVINEKLGLKNSGQINIVWLMGHMSFEELAVFFGLLAFIVTAGFWFGRHTARPPDG